MPVTYGSQANVQGNALAISIFSALDSQFLHVQYPERLWKTVIGSQINTSISAGAQNYVHLVKDYQGAAAFMSPVRGANVPRVNLSLGAITTPLCVIGVAADVTNEDARQYAQGNLGTLPQDLQYAMREAHENLWEATFFFGDASIGFQPWMNYTGIYTQTAAATGTGSPATTSWANKTPLEIWADINAALTTFYLNSNTLFIADTIYLPPLQYAALQQPFAIGSGPVLATSILEYVLKNNISTQLGKTLKIVPIRYLAAQSTHGDGSSGRAVLMEHDKRYQEMAIPLPYTIQPPVPALFGATLAAESKIGSFACYQPGSMMYLDGI